ncbi:MAG TPA: hypothetical protein VJG83_03955 [archaeon]|nr:hypothetical protein [archaeon]
MAEYALHAQYRETNPAAKVLGVGIAVVGLFLLITWFSSPVAENTDLLISIALLLLGGYLFFTNPMPSPPTISIEGDNIQKEDIEDAIRSVEKSEPVKAMINELKK